jgi:hypothetical protein
METPEVDAGLHLPVRQHTSARELNRAPLTGGELGGVGNLDKIRDLLFGDQMRDSDRRLNRLEERLMKGHAELQDDMRRRFESLERFVKKEVESLTERLKAEQAAREEGLSEVSRSLHDLLKTFEKKTGQLGEQAADAQRELRQQIMDQSKSLRDEFLEKYRELSDSFGQTIQELRIEKTDRLALATIFSEMALRLNADLTMPTIE